MNAFVLRLIPGQVQDNFELALRISAVGPGWSAAPALNETHDYERFRQSVHDTHYSRDTNYVRSGRAAGQLWRFMFDIAIGDYILVPRPHNFYVARVLSDVSFVAEYATPQDMAYQRKVEWLNNAQPIPRIAASRPLQARLKIYHTLAPASEFVDEIEKLLEEAGQGVHPSFYDETRSALKKELRQQLLGGRINDYGLENIVRDLLLRMGARGAEITARRYDVGDDIVFHYGFGSMFSQRVVVQVKHHDDWTSASRVVGQLVAAMEKHQTDLAIGVSTAAFTEDAEGLLTSQAELGNTVILVDGDQLVDLLLSNGLFADSIK